MNRDVLAYKIHVFCKWQRVMNQSRCPTIRLFTILLFIDHFEWSLMTPTIRSFIIRCFYSYSLITLSDHWSLRQYVYIYVLQNMQQHKNDIWWFCSSGSFLPYIDESLFPVQETAKFTYRKGRLQCSKSNLHCTKINVIQLIRLK